MAEQDKTLSDAANALLNEIRASEQPIFDVYLKPLAEGVDHKVLLELLDAGLVKNVINNHLLVWRVETVERYNAMTDEERQRRDEWLYDNMLWEASEYDE